MICDSLQECKVRCQYFTKHGHRHQRTHLKDRLQHAINKADENAEYRILHIIKWEPEKSFWRNLNWALGQKQGSSISSVQIEEDNSQITECSTQPKVQLIMCSKIQQERYHLTEEAPICQGRLCGDFGYNAAIPAGTAVLNGTYNPLYLVHEGT